MAPLQNRAMIKAVTIFLLVMVAVLLAYIVLQSSSQVEKGKDVVKQKSNVIACAEVVFSVKGIAQSGNSLAVTIGNEGYSNGNIETATLRSGGVSMKKDLNIDPGIEKRLQLDNFVIVGNFTVEINDCEDYAKVCTAGGCQSRI